MLEKDGHDSENPGIILIHFPASALPAYTYELERTNIRTPPITIFNLLIAHLSYIKDLAKTSNNTIQNILKRNLLHLVEKSHKISSKKEFKILYFQFFLLIM